MRKTIHFLETEKGYQLLTSTAYNEFEYKWIKKEVVEELDEKEIKNLFSKPWQEVREYIKNKVNSLTK